jgi:hypothetical protein
MGFYNQILWVFLSKVISILIACDKNNHIVQVEKPHFPSMWW